MKLLCFGCGYIAQNFAKLILGERGIVMGTTCDEANFQSLRAQGIQPLIFKDDQPFEWKNLKDVTHILVSIPPDQEGDVVINSYFQGVDYFPNLKWLGYLSTTGVYGDHQGAWVTEESSCLPTQARSQIRLKIELSWFDLWENNQVPVHIFRLSGIYGPKRNIFEQIKTGTAQRVYKTDHVFSRMHVDDIVMTLFTSSLNPQAGEIFNLADDVPAATEELISYGCYLLGIKSPPLIPFHKAQLSPTAREFYVENKRVSNQKIKQDLKIKLLYPSYKEGLKSLVHIYKNKDV